MREVEGYPLPLGVTKREGIINFSLAVEGGRKCRLVLYKENGKEAGTFEMPKEKAVGDVRFLAFEGLADHISGYHYRIEDEVYIDPYAKKIKKNYALISLKDYDWEGDRPLHIPYQDVIAYSLHVRGFTKHSSSKVQRGGTFLGITDKIPYLKELGINQIQCMPVYYFEDTEKYSNYWGYGPAHCFALKERYAASKEADVEFKDMVKACHKAGIEVVLDFPFSEETPQQMMIEVLHFYMLEYHVDGFIVNPYRAPMQSILEDPLLKAVKIMKKQEDFQVIMRRFLKGDEGMIEGVMWWLKHHSGKENLFNYITNHTGFTLADLVSYDRKHNELNGENNHDGPEYNYSWNCGAEGPTRKRAILELRRKQMRNAFCLLLTAQGVPCILAGDEFANTQKGNNNVYCQDNELAWLNWKQLEKEQELFDFVKKLIQFRKEHPVLHAKQELLGIDRISCGMPDVSYHGESAWRVQADVASRQLGIYYCGQYASDDDCFIAYNMHWIDHTFALPSLPKGKKWYKVVSTDAKWEEETLLEDQRKIELKERTVALLIGR